MVIVSIISIIRKAIIPVVVSPRDVLESVIISEWVVSVSPIIPSPIPVPVIVIGRAPTIPIKRGVVIDVYCNVARVVLPPTSIIISV